MTTTGSEPTDPHRPPSLGDVLGKEAQKRLDDHADKIFQGWFTRQSSDRKIAASVLLLSALIGVVGMPIIEAISAAMKPQMDVRTVAAIFWLAVLTLPLFAYMTVLVWAAGRGHPMVVMGLATLAALLGGWILSEAGVPTKIGNLYCFASFDSGGLYYEQECRTFDYYGFVADTADSLQPSEAPEFFGWLLVYVAKARGFVMAVCGFFGGIASGFLLRDADA
jgi:hypothetical protein